MPISVFAILFVVCRLLLKFYLFVVNIRYLFIVRETLPVDVFIGCIYWARFAPLDSRSESVKNHF